MSCPHGNPIGGCDTCDEVDAAFEAGKRSALAEQPAQQQEPVAIIASLMPAERHALLEEGYSIHEPLYTSPPAQRKPLTEDEIEQAYRNIWRSIPADFDHTSMGWIEQGIRYAEQAHGIKGEA